MDIVGALLRWGTGRPAARPLAADGSQLSLGSKDSLQPKKELPYSASYAPYSLGAVDAWNPVSKLNNPVV